MAEEDESQKTEEPTPKKLREAQEKGEVPQSQELKTWFMLATGTAVLASVGGYIGMRMVNPFASILSNLHSLNLDEVGVINIVMGVVYSVFILLLIPFGAFVVAAILSVRSQHASVFTFEKIQPKLSKISPLGGLKRMFSSRMLVEFAKITAKLIAVAAVITAIVYPERDRLDTLMLLSFADIVSVIETTAVRLMLGVLLLLTVIAALDYSYQRYQHHKKLRMSKQEIKDEHKQTDGDPQVKGRLRSIRMERARQRMMAAVPDSDVVITNPTHFAVALEYKHGEMEVPKLVAKGVDTVAFKIRELAEEYQIPVVENPPLARALFASVELEEEVPPDHYKAVAEVISYVMKLRRAGFAPKRPAKP